MYLSQLVYFHKIPVNTKNVLQLFYSNGHCGILEESMAYSYLT